MLSRSTSSTSCVSTTETAYSREKKATLKALPNTDLLRILQTPASGKFHIWRCEKPRLLFVRELGLTQTKFLYVLQDVKLHSCHYSQTTHMFPENRPSEIQFFWWVHQPHCVELFMHSILWRGEARHIICVIVCSTSNTFTWQRISFAIVRLQHRILADFVGTISWAPMSYQIECLHLDFMGLFCCGCLKKRLEMWGRFCDFSMTGMQHIISTIWKDVR